MGLQFSNHECLFSLFKKINEHNLDGAVKLQGLDARKMYKVKEINLMPNSKSNLDGNEKTYSGDYLMKVGINAFTTNQAFSRVIEITTE